MVNNAKIFEDESLSQPEILTAKPYADNYTYVACDYRRCCFMNILTIEFVKLIFNLFNQIGISELGKDGNIKRIRQGRFVYFSHQASQMATLQAYPHQVDVHIRERLMSSHRTRTVQNDLSDLLLTGKKGNQQLQFIIGHSIHRLIK